MSLKIYVYKQTKIKKKKKENFRVFHEGFKIVSPLSRPDFT